MTKSFLSICIFGIGIGLAGLGLAEDSRFSRPLASDAATGGMSFSLGGEVHIAAMITNVDGRVAVCGLWTKAQNISGVSKSLAMLRKGMGSGSIQYGNRTLLRGLSFMNEVAREDYVVGTKAACKMTKKAWQPSMSNKKLRIRIPRFRVHS